jgi:hypothetical protein
MSRFAGHELNSFDQRLPLLYLLEKNLATLMFTGMDEFPLIIRQNVT